MSATTTDTQPAATVTRRKQGSLQAGTVTIATIGDLPKLTIYYSYDTPIGYQIDGQPAQHTDRYYSVRTDVHADDFGRRDKAAVIVADPELRAALVAACKARGLAEVPIGDFRRKEVTSFPDSPYFGGKPERGQNPRNGGTVYVLRPDGPPFNTTDRGLAYVYGYNGTYQPTYKVRCTFMGKTRADILADDGTLIHPKGSIKIRPCYMGYGEYTEIVSPDVCQTEGGAESFPD